MPYDEDLAGRLREILAERGPYTEKKMFGGLSSLVGGGTMVSPPTAAGT